MATKNTGLDVFINCPFDDGYQSLLNALVFVVLDCGFRPRSALEEENSGNVRYEKVIAIIRECSFGIHDISRTDLDPENRLPRFNMPFELGLFLGAKAFGGQQTEGQKLPGPRSRALPISEVSV